MDRDDVGPSVGIGERDGDGHLAAHVGIGCLDSGYFDNSLIRDQFHEAAVKGVGVRARLAGLRRCVVRQRDAERTSLARVELVNDAGDPTLRALPSRD